jgi:SAM-dependent methyltransferase
VDLDRTATIGRQWVYRLGAGEVDRIFRGFDRPLEPGEAQRLLEEDDGYADAVLRRLGARELSALDASAYEGSQIVHDMNLPLPDDLRRRFTTVIDGGSLEHVFNFPTALANCMEMVEPGGRLILMTPGNNYFGHGFYQTSPELYHRALVPDNGFEVERLLICHHGWRERWYEVADPADVGRRVELLTSMPVNLYVRARRVNDARALATAPQQSDYEVKWSGGATVGGGAAIRALKRARDLLPGRARDVVAVQVARRRALLDRRAFRAVSPEALARGG